MSTSTWDAEALSWGEDESPFAPNIGETEPHVPFEAESFADEGWASPWHEGVGGEAGEGEWFQSEEEGSEAPAEEAAPIHRCAPSEGPPAALKDPTGRGPHPVVSRGSGPASRNPAVGYAQQLLNRFLADTARGLQGCVDLSRERLSYMQDLRGRLRRNGQDPLVVDCRFGPNTEYATKLFQACYGLVRDGKIGPVTWHYLRRYAPAAPVNPPDTSTCGVPDRPAAEFEQELDVERMALHQAPARRRTAVRARLSLFQNATVTSHRNHFQCQASRIARMVSAYADPRVDRCDPRSVGPTAYDTGADIVSAITAAHHCLGQRLTAVHIVGHSGSHGVFGTAAAGAVGLYVATDDASRAQGARAIVDIPVASLADDVVFVLHGCNQAAGTGSFAERLYGHLSATLSAPLVLAHPNSGCAGRDNSWRRFSTANPGGVAVASIAPHYSGDGCCSSASGEAFTGPAQGEYSFEEAGARRPCGCRR